jgi:Fe-S cluster biogenesis protein NfuA
VKIGGKLMNKIERIIEDKISPLLRSHQGDIQYVDTTVDGVVKVRLTGACSTCSGAQQTVAEIVETAIIAECPEVKKVVAVFAVSDDLIQQALRMIRKGS